MQGELQKPSCGALYRAALEAATGGDPALVPVFAAGFVNGLAEKVYLGACPAAMIRPPAEWWLRVEQIANEAADRYNLWVHVLHWSDVNDPEIWLCRDVNIVARVRALTDVPVNSVDWHARRAFLCGVLSHEVDVQFHERAV